MEEEHYQWDQLKAGESSALSWIYQQYAHPMHRYGRRLVFDDQRVWDAIHDVFVDLWKYRETSNPFPAGFRIYLLRSLRNRLLSPATRLHESLEFHNLPADLLVPSAEILLIEKESSAEKRQQLLHALALLSPRQRQIIQLRFYDDLSYDQIAERLQISNQSARNLLFRAIEFLRSQLFVAVAAGLLALAVSLLALVRL